MSAPTFPGWSYWDFPLGDGWLVLAFGLAVIAVMLYGFRPSRAKREMHRGVRERWQRTVEDWRMWHVDARCTRVRCDCSCGYCRHDRRHVPGDDGAGGGVALR